MNRICCIACLAATAVGIVGRASGTPFSGEGAYVRVTGSLPEIRIYGDRRVYIFTNTSEAAEIAVKTRLTLEEYLVVGGGGAGGHSIGGGGGGGGVVYSNEAQVVEGGSRISVTVGAGGRQKSGATWKSGGSGGHSVLGIAGKSIVAYGGGGGGGRAFNNGIPEAAVVAGEIGSGGGAVGSSAGTENQQWNPNQGNPVGTGGAGGSKTDGGGGGGGADEGAVGGSNSSASAGNGGEGLAFDLTGETVVYGSGGGGGTRYDAHDAGKGGTNAGDGRRGLAGALDSRELVRAESGVDGTGGGGGGGGAPASGSGADLNGEGGDGGCGTVVLVFTEGDHRVSRFGIAEIGDCIYPGRDVTPAVTVMNSAGEVLSPETDYTVAYRDNDAPGTAVAIATGRDGTPYAGFSAIRPFTILAAAYSDDLIASSVSLGVRRIEIGRRIAYVFTNTSDVAQIVTKKSLTLEEYLAVGGGGAGGHSIGGGGGGGGVVHSNAVQLMESGSALYVSVGAGGVQKTGATWKSGGSGGHTVLDFAGQRIVAYGGGGGGGRSYNNGVPEAAVVEKEIGSGGGAVGGSVGAVDQQWNPKQGNAGGTGAAGSADGDGGGGGGGGAGTVGGSYTATAAGDGGEGLVFGITGANVVYGSGGGGGTRSSKRMPGKGGTNAGSGSEGVNNETGTLVRAESGVDGTGGGGGGGGAPTDGSASDLNSEGGDGGCGTVVLVFTEGDHRVSRFDIAEIGDRVYRECADKPAVTVMNSAGEVLSPETDYTVAYRDNDAPGTAVAIATGRDGTPYAGYSAVRLFRIVAAAYTDDLIMASDATVRRLKNGKRIAYVITNASESVVVQTKRKLKLREYLVVGGGGAGGHSIGGGGGGGGVVHSNVVQLLERGSSLSISVGAGGVQKPGGTWKSGGSGGHTVLDFAGQRIVAYGGGGGGGRGYNNGVPEAALVEREIGSGGGAVGGSVGAVDQQWNPKQGNPGGTGGVGDAGGNGGGGGGGGAGAGGGSYTSTAAGDGGEGLAFDIVGERVVYGSGGGGGTRSNKQRPGKGGTNAGDGREGGTDELVRAESGVDGTGGGGGGGGAPTDGSDSDLNSEGGDGGCGTVILVFTECAGLSVIVR